MRIATSTVTNMAQSSISNAYTNWANIINKITSNKNFSKMSENVTDATKVLKLKNQLAQLDEYQSNIKAAQNEMNLAYDTLGIVSDELSNINSLIIEASNVTTTPDSAKALASEIKQKVATITDKMNTKYLDNFIFSGTYTQNQTYKTDEDGNIIYQGSSKQAGERNLTVAEGKTFTYNLTAQEIFAAGADEEFFSQMKELDELLNAQTLDYDAIRDKLNILDKVNKNITQARGEISAKVTKLDTLENSNNDTILSLTQNRADLEEVDIIKAASDLANAQTALQASYLASSSILGSVSLLDYL